MTDLIISAIGLGICIAGIDIRQIISLNPNGTCLWVKTPYYYMEVDCPDKDNMNARFEADGKIINKSFHYSFTGFLDACDWFDEKLIASQRG